MTPPPLTGFPIRSAAQLTDHWAALLDPPVFGARSLWLMWLDDDGRPLPLVIPVDGVPEVPSRELLFGLLSLHDGICAEHRIESGHLAMALCRPGLPDITDADDEWVDALCDRLNEQIDGTWSLHLAAGGTVQPLSDLRS